MFFAWLWLIAEVLIWRRLWVMAPTHRTVVNVIMAATVAFQIFTVIHITYRAWKQSLLDNLRQRERDDALEEMRREEGDNRPLSRYDGLSTKNPKDMTGPELLAYMKQLHGRSRLNPGSKHW